MTQKMAKWLKARLATGPEARVLWLSYAQLYVDFQCAYGHPGPLKVCQRWVDVDTRPYLMAGSYTFKARLKWFRQFMKHFFRYAGIRAAMAQCRPHSDHIQTFVQSVSVPWDTMAIEVVERWLGERLPGPCVRGASLLHGLPLVLPSAIMAV